MSDWKRGEIAARRALEDRGFTVHDANVLFRENCPNIDLVVYGSTSAKYVQVKSSVKPSAKNAVLVDGAPWTEDQLAGNAPIYNKHNGAFRASLVIIVDEGGHAEPDFYIAPPDALSKVALRFGQAFIAKPKRNGERRKMFRKQVDRAALAEWRQAWQLFGD